MQPLELIVAAHAIPAADLAERLRVDPSTGLDASEAQARLTAEGPNELEPPRRVSIWTSVIDAATEPFVVLLALAGVLAVLLGEVRDGLLILGRSPADRGSGRCNGVSRGAGTRGTAGSGCPTGIRPPRRRPTGASGARTRPRRRRAPSRRRRRPGGPPLHQIRRLDDRPQHPDRGVVAGGGIRHARSRGRSVGRPAVDGVQRDECRPGTRRRHRRRNRPED